MHADYILIYSFKFGKTIGSMVGNPGILEWARKKPGSFERALTWC